MLDAVEDGIAVVVLPVLVEDGHVGVEVPHRLVCPLLRCREPSRQVMLFLELTVGAPVLQGRKRDLLARDHGRQDALVLAGDRGRQVALVLAGGAQLTCASDHRLATSKNEHRSSWVRLSRHSWIHFIPCSPLPNNSSDVVIAFCSVSNFAFSSRASCVVFSRSSTVATSSLPSSRSFFFTSMVRADEPEIAATACTSSTGQRERASPSAIFAPEPSLF
mmetsp:Transcript_2804/g.9391  ORF Transcript_2804/g.9391 Transcript_2804/m.9391 type:complete len:219 (-) Transcript_2804:160-816(-)